MRSLSKRLKSYISSKLPSSTLDVALKSYMPFKAKFDESLDVCFKLNIPKSKKNSVSFRSYINLPVSFDVDVAKKILLLTSIQNHDQFSSMNFSIIGGSDLVDKILSDEVTYDIILATDDFLPYISKLARKLGPKGMMPSVKSGTVCSISNLQDTFNSFSSQRVELKLLSDLTVKCRFGKLSMQSSDISSNLNAVKEKLSSLKPKDLKIYGSFVKCYSISSSMGFSFNSSSAI